MTAVVLAVGGATVIGVALARRHTPPPRPSLAAAGSITPTTAPTKPSPATTTRRRSVASPRPLTYSAPTEIAIPAIGVDSLLTTLGQNADGTVAVPISFHLAGWYEHSVTPGQKGPTVILGHVDSTSGPGIFYRLGALHPGDTVKVTRRDGRVVAYLITGVRQYTKTSFPTLDVYGNTSIPTIRLVTCGGAFDSATHHYLSNIVAYGQLA